MSKAEPENTGRGPIGEVESTTAAPAPQLRRRARNALALTISGAVAKFCVFISVIILVKRFSVEDNGAFQLAWVIGYLYAYLTELGLRGPLVRELARQRDDAAAAQAIFGDSLYARMAVAVSAAPLLVFFLQFAGYPNRTIVYVLWFILYALLDSVAMLLKFALRAFERMELDAICTIAGRGGLLLIVCLLQVSHHLNLATATAAHISTATAELIVLCVILPRVVPLRIFSAANAQRSWRLVVSSAPFAAITLAAIVYQNAGTLTLSLFRSEAAVGQYRTPARLCDAALFFPNALVNAFLPHLARRHADPKTIGRYLEFLVRYVGFAGLFLAALMIFETPFVIRVIAKIDYLPFARVWQVLGAWVVFGFMQYVTLNMLFLMDLERAAMRRVATVLSLNLIATFIFVRPFGAVGIASVLLATEIAAVVLDFAILQRARVHVPWVAMGQAVAYFAAVAGVLVIGRELPLVARLGAAGVVGGGIIAFFAWKSDRHIIHKLLRRSS